MPMVVCMWRRRIRSCGLSCYRRRWFDVCILPSHLCALLTYFCLDLRPNRRSVFSQRLRCFIPCLFVSNIGKDPKALAIVSSIASMGREARITVIAEGLENPQDILLLENAGCQQVQGFAYSRPLSLSNLLEYQEFTLSASAANMV